MANFMLHDVPLPKRTRRLLKNHNGEIDNLFLLYYRYVWAWQHRGRSWEVLNKVVNKEKKLWKKNFLEAVADRAQHSEAAREHLAQYRRRFEAHLRTLEGSDGWRVRRTRLRTEWRLAAGLGYKGALETGLTLHPLHGFPYLPGTSVKGVARAWAEDVAPTMNPPTATADDVLAVFGSRPKNEEVEDEKQLGGVRFFDALPKQFPKLELDVMTPHFGPYYENPADNPPGDWHNPVPVLFLTVAADSEFCFALAARREDEAALDQAASWLRNGFQNLGAGGKTSAGYGFFTEQTVAERGEEIRQTVEAKREKTLAALEERSAQEDESAPADTESAPPEDLGPVPEGYRFGMVEKIKFKGASGYGRIAPGDGGEAIRFDFEDADMTGLNEGAAAIFKIEERGGKRRAVHVRRRKEA